MNWLEIVTILLGGTSVVSVVQLILTSKENKQLKQNEVKQSDISEQKERIDLGVIFINKVKEIYDKLDMNQNDLLTKLDGIESTVSDIVTYLDGDFHNWQKNRNTKNT